MSDFIISPAARQDLMEIWEYIAQDNLDAADCVAEEIRAEIRMLAQNLGLGHYRTDLANEPLKFWRVYTYLIIFRPETQPLEIVRILSEYQDLKRILE